MNAIPPQRSSKSRMPIWLAASAGCILFVLGSLCCIAGSFLLFKPSSPTPKTSGESLGTFVVDASGGSFTHEQLSIRVAPGAVQKEIQLTVYRDTASPNYLEQGADSSTAYRISGPMAELNGEMEISLILSKELISSAQGSGGLALEGSGYSTSYGETQHILPLPTAVDPVERTASATLHLQGTGGVGAVPQAGAAALLNFLSNGLSAQVRTPEDFSVRFVPGLIYDAYLSEHFAVSYLSKLHDANLARKALLLLEQEYEKIHDLGFDFDESARIPVTVMYLEGKTGQFVSDKRGASYCAIELNSQYFRDANLFNAKIKDLTATIGHELLHLAQFSMDPRYAFFKARFPGPVLWMDEAVATWYEPLAVQDQNYIPMNANQNVRFVQNPLLFPPSDKEEAQNHGYGASFFIQYLAGKYSSHFPAEIYSEIAGGAGSASEALVRALQRHQTDLDTEWIAFVETYFGSPEMYHNPNRPEIWAIGLNAANTANDSGEIDTLFVPNQNLQSHVTRVQNGTFFAREPAVIELAYTQPGLTASGFILLLGSTPEALSAFQSPGVITIAVHAPADAGVLVLAQPANSNSYVPLAGAPYGFLSLGDTRSNNGRLLTIDGFGHPGSGNQYKRLMFIPFNSHADPSDPGEPLPITIQISYAQKDAAPPEVEEPDPFPPDTPSTSPSQEPPLPEPESNHACAGVSLGKMKQPLGHASKCWLTCFGIGSGSHSDAEIQSCIDAHQ
jgi:hypothetical protein